MEIVMVLSVCTNVGNKSLLIFDVSLPYPQEKTMFEGTMRTKNARNYSSVYPEKSLLAVTMVRFQLSIFLTI